jgi:hypothetical protein
MAKMLFNMVWYANLKDIPQLLKSFKIAWKFFYYDYVKPLQLLFIIFLLLCFVNVYDFYFTMSNYMKWLVIILYISHSIMRRRAQIRRENKIRRLERLRIFKEFNFWERISYVQMFEKFI